MNKIELLLSIVGITSLLSCSRTDFSNPEEVIKSYQSLWHENKNELLYQDFLSQKSKDFVTKDEYSQYNVIHDTTEKSSRILEAKIFIFPVDINNASFRRVKVEEKGLSKSDTVYLKRYFTLSNEDGKWKVIWTSTILSFAYQKWAGGNYSEARKSAEKIIEIDPYSGRTYCFLASCYSRDKSLSSEERVNGFLKNAKYAIALEEDMPMYLNTLAAYYEAVGNTDLAIETYGRGLKYCQNKESKRIIYLNLAQVYNTQAKFDRAEEYVIKAIKDGSEDCSIWFVYGNIMKDQKKFERALEYYKKALDNPKMDNSLQGNLYYDYAYCSREKGNCLDAKEYINKALDIEPNNDTYQSLYKSIKNCNHQSSSESRI